MKFPISPVSNPPQEWALALMAILAFPDCKDDGLFLGNVVADLSHQYLLSKIDFESEQASLPRFMKPIYVFRDPKSLAKNLKAFDRHI